MKGYPPQAMAVSTSLYQSALPPLGALFLRPDPRISSNFNPVSMDVSSWCKLNQTCVAVEHQTGHYADVNPKSLFIFMFCFVNYNTARIVYSATGAVPDM